MILGPGFKRSLWKETFHRSIRSLLRVGQLFAVVPWGVRLDQRAPQGRTHWAKRVLYVVNVIYSLAIIVAVFIATGFHYSISIRSEFFAIQILHISEDITVNGIVILSLIGCQCLRPFYAKFNTAIVAVGDELFASGGSIDFQQRQSSIRRLLWVALLFFGTLVLFDFLNGDAWPHRFVYRTVLYTLPNVINVLALYQYVVLLGFVCDFYRTVNERLKVLESDTSAPKRVCRFGYRRKILAISDDTIAYDRVELIEILRRTHLEVSTLTGEVNSCFGPLIVCTMLLSFVVLSLLLFLLYKAMSTVRWSYRECINLISLLLWIGFHVAKILLVLYPCQLVQRERDRTGPMLYTFEHSFADNYLHKAMVGALTTYLVILIQFDSAFVSVQRTGDGEGTPAP
ncbi:AGAP006716-PA-like protein [Anopheles sinensis]|uniref:Gustatory receptor n=1 Tax=Anopheles sinensis TaxID=74873 RepID=A0A084WLL2_ANOSI|nr:AGAP006716-PA-like protein [Anopheles sinensis]